MLCRNGNPVANTITRFLVWLVEGMPVLVLLMILYYIIFGKVSISGTFVSVIGFTLLFGAQVYSMVKAGVATVDRGQTEAAYSLGYTDRKAFFRVVLPQAIPHIMPTYKGQIKALIKATAIVGYVAVQDLTRRFIRRLKVMELKIDGPDFDFSGAGSAIDFQSHQ